MNEYSFRAYQQDAERTINYSVTDQGVELHALHGMASEVGEIHGIYQKIYQGHGATDEHIKEEVGDLLWFIAEFCTVNGWEMAEIAQGNIEKLRSRYPNGFSAEKSLHRDEEAAESGTGEDAQEGQAAND